MQLTRAELQEVRETLKDFGLSDALMDAYFVLLERGVMTATPLAQELKIPLTTAQSLLQRLSTMGIVEMTKRKSRSVYEAKDPSVFKRLLEQKMQDIGTMIPLLKTLRADEKSPAKIRVYTRERVTDIFNQALHAKTKLVYEIVSAKELQKILGERFHFTKRRVAESVRLRSLRVEAGEIKKYNKRIHDRELREARFLPRELMFTCSIMFWDDTVAFFTPPEEGLAWIVESKAFALTMRQLFEMLWSVSRRMETLVE